MLPGHFTHEERPGVPAILTVAYSRTSVVGVEPRATLRPTTRLEKEDLTGVAPCKRLKYEWYALLGRRWW